MFYYFIWVPLLSMAMVSLLIILYKFSCTRNLIYIYIYIYIYISQLYMSFDRSIPRICLQIGVENTLKTSRAFLSSFHPKVKELIQWLERIGDRKSRHKVSVRFTQLLIYIYIYIQSEWVNVCVCVWERERGDRQTDRLTERKREIGTLIDIEIERAMESIAL